MTALQAAQEILVNRTVNVFTNMRDSLDSPSEYPAHFQQMGELIEQIETYGSFGAICDAVSRGDLDVIGFVGDNDELEVFLKDISNLMNKFNNN